MATQKQEKRVTVTYTDPKYHERISQLAREHGVSQGEVIEVLLDTVYDEHFLIEGLIKKREDKVGARTSIRAIIQRTKGLGAQERQKALKAVAK